VSDVGVVAVAGLVAVVLCAAGLLGHLDRPAAALGKVWRRLRPRPVRPDTVSVEQLAADLRRLANLLEQTYSTDQPAKMARLTAASLAYDYVLLAACRTLEIPTPQTPPLQAVERLQTEAELARSGLDW
jgi:hypothetical protein